MFKHEDNRRVLLDWANGKFETCKALIAKDGCVVGDHHHLHKDESFLLIHGKASLVQIGATLEFDVLPPAVWHVPRGTYHKFTLRPGSILIGTATAPFDPTDEHPGHPCTNSTTNTTAS